MSSRKFKPGDWVKIKGKDDSPRMEILKYIPNEDPLTGITNNDSVVPVFTTKMVSGLQETYIKTGS
jgi:hypothetical protein